MNNPNLPQKFTLPLSHVLNSALQNYLDTSASVQDEVTEAIFILPSEIPKTWDKMYETMTVKTLDIRQQGAVIHEMKNKYSKPHDSCSLMRRESYQTVVQGRGICLTPAISLHFGDITENVVKWRCLFCSPGHWRESFRETMKYTCRKSFLQLIITHDWGNSHPQSVHSSHTNQQWGRKILNSQNCN